MPRCIREGAGIRFAGSAPEPKAHLLPPRTHAERATIERTEETPLTDYI